MGIVFRQSIKTSMVIFTGALLGILTIWLSTKYIARQPLGFTGNLTYNCLLLAQIAILGLNSTLTVYIHKYPAGDPRRSVLLSLCIGLPVLLCFIAAGPFLLIRPWVLLHFQETDQWYMNRYYLLIPVYTLLFVLQILLEQFLGTQMKVAIAAFIREVVVRLFIIAFILLFAAGYISFDAFVVASVLVYLVPILVYLFIAIRDGSFSFSLKLRSLAPAEYKELWHFSWYHFLLAMSITLMSYLDSVALPLYDHSGFVAAAVYRVAIFLISFLQMPSKAMLNPVVTVLSQAIAEDNQSKIKDVFARSSINILIATVFMAAIIICNLDNAISVLSKGYEQIGLIFLILFLGRIVDLATGVNDAILSVTKHYKFSFYISIGLIALLFGLIKWLVPVYGVYGAAWATSITLILFNLGKFLYVWLKLDMQPFSIHTLQVLLAGAVTIAAGYFFPHFLAGKGHMYIYTFIDAGLRSVIIAAVYLLMLYWLKPSADLREYVASIKKNKRLF
jgi:O-antigen/teichoic acid export membrane protein